MILPERVLGSSSVNRIVFGFAIGPMSWATWLRSSSTSSSRGSTPPRRVTNAAMACPVVGVGAADDRGLGDRGVVDQRGLDLGGRDVVAGDEHDVVDAAEQPEVAVVVALGAVAGEVLAVEARPVGVAVALGIAPDAAQHRRPRPRQHEVAAAGDPDRLARRRRRCRPRCRAAGTSRSRASSVVAPGQRADHDRAGLGLPPRVDDGTARAADRAVVPDPRFRIDRFADRSDQPQRRQVVRGRAGRRPTS